MTFGNYIIDNTCNSKECKWDDVQSVSLYRLSIYQTYNMHYRNGLFVIYVKYATLKKKKKAA